MKSIPVLFILIAVATLMQCKVQKEIAYELPEAMIPTAKIEFAKQCEKGKILYDITCAGCHNIKEKRKELIPDFTAAQLVGYELRITNAAHETGISEERVSTEELGYIMTFLSYKKKSGRLFISSKDKKM